MSFESAILPLAPLPSRDVGPAGEIRALHPEATFLRILDVDYVHIKTEDEGELYLTPYGVPFFRQLRPSNWYEPTWFKRNRQRLEGTGTVYRVPTRPDGALRSIDLVVKWSRVGQDVPLDTFTLNRQINAEFNTPFEEFALVEELRRGEPGANTPRILAQKPLAIYIPPEQMQLWQSGRSREKIMAKSVGHPMIEIDVLRSYILLYGWVDGLNAVEAYRGCCNSAEELSRRLEKLTLDADRDLAERGFLVADHKPVHLIVRVRDGKVRQRRDGRVAYVLIDYELLARTEARQDSLRLARRREYLRRERERFLPRPDSELPPHLKRIELLGVPYIYGRAESTAGWLWVLGNDPGLFKYFLPERWRRKQVKLSRTNDVYYARSKDFIELVWKVSHVGELPPGDLSDPGFRDVLLVGYNSPFEEAAIALDLSRRGVKTVYPRAIYVTGSSDDLCRPLLDERRFERHKCWRSPDGRPVLAMDHDYVMVWGYYRGLEDAEAIEGESKWTPIDVLRAMHKGIISESEAQEFLARQERTLADAGYRDWRLRPDHILISYIPGNGIKLEADGRPELRHCNFETMAETTCRLDWSLGGMAIGDGD